jgi:hypothetical protein
MKTKEQIRRRIDKIRKKIDERGVDLANAHNTSSGSRIREIMTDSIETDIETLYKRIDELNWVLKK